MQDPAGPNLSLWNKGLGVVPTWVWERTELETLVLAENGLSDLPDRIGGLKKLRMLDLGHNKLTRLSLSAGQSTDHAASIAAATGKASLSEPQRECVRNDPRGRYPYGKPDELRVTDNRLTSIPDRVGRLSRLRELHLRNNKLTSLPESIGALLELRQIDLRDNPLTHLPAGLAALPRLEKLDLRWIATLAPPPWFADLEARGCAIYR
jgi:Leucine-rich repeat (LRR) protein